MKNLTIKVWDLETNRCKQTLIGHREAVYTIIKINKSIIASGSRDYTIKIWDFINGDCIKTISGHTETIICLIKLSSNSIISTSTDETIKVWNLDFDGLSENNLIKTIKAERSTYNLITAS